jgi:hypothetical protein
VCTCGCRSLGLADDEGAARSTASPARLTIRAAGRDPDGTPVEVILHAVGGRLVELEIWPGHEGPCALPDPGTLGRVVVDVVP